MSFEYCQEVANDYEKILESDEEYDVIICSGEDENAKEIFAHLFVLRTRSQYFRTEFSKNRIEVKDGKYIFRKPNISPQIFKIILRFIYCGKMDLTKLQGSEILNLLMAVEELNIQILTQCIQKYLIKHQREFLQQIFSIETLEMCYQHESFKDLWNFYLEIISKEPEILFNSNKFINLKAPLLELILKENFLLLDEIVKWDRLIKWSFAKNSSIQHDVKKWNKEEITIMERTFHKFIPLIKFYNISPDDFVSKVYPYNVLLPKDLASNILSIDKKTSKHQKYDTNIVRPRHFAIFSSWIEKKNDTYYNIRDTPYRFNLIYRASSDGNTADAFHEKCDNKGPTIVIAKVANSKQIIGGYNSFQWDSSDNYKTTKNSFIFSLTNKAKVCHINKDHFTYSVYCHQNYGPTFGRGHDLYHAYCTTWRSFMSSYPEIDIPTNLNANDHLYNEFEVEDYEVFQVLKINNLS
ncbi:hypothetical protein RclHR1_02140004 [Rhizophagus clarus]|uniref:BTB/POZ domain-containing protein n=1 Tax=Rhizophagus clarus TaxID=94130 RepID=A0A2Z6R8E9_9GLOM|nr:hypothetical protein RclHR1_02140004 [Rhizophagus clarus]GES84977.1 BTB/POZ domain-containing protein [Rhizophagus clarus]